jgi:hypothetical protein
MATEMWDTATKTVTTRLYIYIYKFVNVHKTSGSMFVFYENVFFSISLISYPLILINLLRRSVSVLYKDSERTALYTLSTSVIKTNHLMFYKAKVAVCSEIRTKHINAMRAPRRIF